MKTKTGEIEREAVAIEVSRECPECHSGEMEGTSGMVLMSYPEQYPHKCNNCGHKQHYSGVQYPYIKHGTKKTNQLV